MTNRTNRACVVLAESDKIAKQDKTLSISVYWVVRSIMYSIPILMIKDLVVRKQMKNMQQSRRKKERKKHSPNPTSP